MRAPRADRRGRPLSPGRPPPPPPACSLSSPTGQNCFFCLPIRIPPPPLNPSIERPRPSMATCAALRTRDRHDCSTPAAHPSRGSARGVRRRPLSRGRRALPQFPPPLPPLFSTSFSCRRQLLLCLLSPIQSF